MAWLIVGDSYINLDAISQIRVTEEDGVIKVTFYKIDGMILEHIKLPKMALHQLYRALSYLTKAIPIGITELPPIEVEKE